MLQLDKPQQSALNLEMIANTSLAAAKGFQNLYYRWSKDFLEAAKQRLTKRRAYACPCPTPYEQVSAMAEARA